MGDPSTSAGIPGGAWRKAGTTMPKDIHENEAPLGGMPRQDAPATGDIPATGDLPADGVGSEDAEEYETTVRGFLENRDKLLEEIRLLQEQSEQVLTEGTEGGADGGGPLRPEGDSPESNDDSGHIADVISEDGEAVSGAVIWSSSGRKFVVMSADGSPLTDLEAEQAMELVDKRRIAFDNADERERFVSQMSSMGVDVDQDKVDMGHDGSTGELLVNPDELIGNERHHISGEHAGENVEWDDEVDLSDPESTGPQRIEEILQGQSADDGDGPGKPPRGRISGARVYQADNLMTLLAVLLIVMFYILVLAFQQPTPFMMGVWSTLCVAATTAVMMPFTMSMKTREKTIGGKFLLTSSLCVVFLVMSIFLLCDAMDTGKTPWRPGDERDAPAEGTITDPAEEAVILDFEPSGDVVALEMTGSTKSYPAVAIGDVLVTTSEASKANSLTASLGGKHYVTQTVATIDGLGISAFTVESADISNPASIARSLSIGQDVIVYSIGEDGVARVEGTTIKSTTFPVGAHGLPESSEIDKVFVDRNLEAGTLVMDMSGRLVGIAPEAGDGVVTATSISRAVNVLTSNDNEIYLGIVCRQASISENEDGGAYVENVLTQSPASNAGIMTGDIIVSVDGTPIEGTEDLDKVIGKHEAGEQVSLGIIRGDQRIALSVTIGQHGKDINLGAEKGDKSASGKGSSGKDAGTGDKSSAKKGASDSKDSSQEGQNQ